MAPVFFNAFKNARVIPKLNGNNRGRGGSESDVGSAEGEGDDNGNRPVEDGAVPPSGGDDGGFDPKDDDGDPPVNPPV
jgi:hypothetical protein